jgi:hypothetical protein
LPTAGDRVVRDATAVVVVAIAVLHASRRSRPSCLPPFMLHYHQPLCTKEHYVSTDGAGREKPSEAPLIVFPLRLCDRRCLITCTEAERADAAPLLVRVPRPDAVVEHDHGHGRAGIRQGVQLRRQPHVPVPGVRALSRRLRRRAA